MSDPAGMLEDAIVQAIAAPVADEPGIALAASLADALASACDAPIARVWLMGPGDLCGRCPMRDECPDQTRCLHLTASAGTSRRTDGPYRRFPLGARQVGRAARDRRTFVAREGLAASRLAESAWLAAHGVRCFVAVPIAHQATLLGVAAVFSRRDLTTGEIALVELACRQSGAALAATAGPIRRARPRPAGPLELRPWADIERDALRRVLEHTGGRVSGPRGAAAILGLKPTTLASRMKKLGLPRKPR